MPPVCVGAIRASMVRTGSGMSKCVPAVSRDDLVRPFLHPGAQRLGAVELVCRVVVQVLHGLPHAGTGQDPPRRRLHVAGDPGELLLAPGVGLLEVDGRAEEPPGCQLVALTTGRVGLGRAVEQLAQVLAEPPVCRDRRLRAPLQVPPDGVVEGCPLARCLGEEVAKKPSGPVSSSHWAMHSVT